MKKPKARKLNFREKERNKKISKKYKITHDIYRNHREDYDDLVMETAHGLYNFRINIQRKFA